MSDTYAILLVEDCPEDVPFLERALQRCRQEHPLRVLTEGPKAIAYLRGMDGYADRRAYPFPGLVIFDLNVLGTASFEVIEWIRANPSTRVIPIVVVSRSSSPSDINRAYALGVNAYVVKPKDEKAVEEVLMTIGAFWLSVEGPEHGWAATRSTAML